MKVYFRKSVELIPASEIIITDTTTDVYKGEDFWNIIVTIFLEVTSQKSNESIPCYISSVLRVGEQLNIRNSKTLALNTNNRNAVGTMLLKIPTVNS